MWPFLFPEKSACFLLHSRVTSQSPFAVTSSYLKAHSQQVYWQLLSTQCLSLSKCFFCVVVLCFFNIIMCFMWYTGYCWGSFWGRSHKSIWGCGRKGVQNKQSCKHTYTRTRTHTYIYIWIICCVLNAFFFIWRLCERMRLDWLYSQ